MGRKRRNIKMSDRKSSSNTTRDAKKMTDEQFKNLHALKVKDQKGEIIKCTKETISILIHDSYHVNVERQIVQGPDPIVLRYIVDEDLRERFPIKAMLQEGTKVIVDRSWEKAMWCEKRSLRLDVEASSADEKQPGAKSNDSEPEEKKKAKKRASKSPPNDRDRERVVKNVSARVIEVTAKDVVLCFQPEGGDKEPIRLQNDLELDITLCGRKSPEVYKIEDVKDKFTVGEKLKMNAKKKNNVWQVQCLEWPKWGLNHPKECDTISLTPIPEETKKDIDTVEKNEPLSTETSNLSESKECKTIKLTPIPEETNKNAKTIYVEPLRKETSALLQQFVSNDLVDVVLGSDNTTEHIVKSKVDLFEAKAKDDASPKKVNEVENQTILEKPVVPNIEEELVPTIKPEANQGNDTMEPVKENKPYVGMFCRGIYKQDGLEYEGIVRSIASTDDGEYAVVEFIGYGNEEPIWFQDLIESKGEEARDKQRKEALEEETPTVISEDTKEQGEDVEDGPREGWYCRGIYKEVGLEYEAVVRSIETTNVGSYAVVEFLGYGNQEPIWFQDILPSKGDEARQKQMEEANVGAQDEISVQKVTETGDQTILEKQINNEVKQKVLPVDRTDSNKGGNTVEIININKGKKVETIDKRAMIAPKETKSLQNELQEDLANNNQPTVSYETNSYGKNQIANQAKVLVNETIEKLKEPVLVDETIEKVKEPMILIKPDAFAVAKLDDQLAASSKANARPDEPIDLRKSKGCKECIGFVKFTPDALERYTRSVIKRALELRDGIHEQVWKEVSENFSENF